MSGSVKWSKVIVCRVDRHELDPCGSLGGYSGAGMRKLLWVRYERNAGSGSERDAGVRNERLE